ncbi:GNAT family N-acetyltransferase [Fluviispira vulneris]|uniref:GNAT family N-acetyltransferase n=1 Tax=Fluviispira vulneris TaxID=2763012 RepID=UPI0016481426|nr:GNAT family N-acetyltransferase [Fluviispira vulneris]
MGNYSEIKIQAYDENWLQLFNNESEKIIDSLFSDENKSLMSREYCEVHHIGSTAIPGMPAKPVIDIMLELDDLNCIDYIKEKLALLNYTEFHAHVIPHYSYFSRKQNEDIAYHLHIRERGDAQINRHIHFRDYLIHHKEDAKEYAKIKYVLADKFYNNRNAYTTGKESFIQSIDRKAKVWNGRRQKFLPANTNFRVVDNTIEKIQNAIEANITVHMTHFEQYSQLLELKRQIFFTTVLNKSLPEESFNYIFAADFEEEHADKNILLATKSFFKNNLPFCWWIFPNDKPKQLSRYLEKHGFINSSNNIGMYFDLSSWKNVNISLENFSIRQVQDEKGLQDFAYILGNDSDFLDSYFNEIANTLTHEDPLEYYVGYLNDKPVVCGLICYFGRVAGLHCLTTSPDFREKGYGTAMQNFRLARAKSLGYHTAILQASTDGYSLYVKLGWKPVCEFKGYKKI